MVRFSCKVKALFKSVHHGNEYQMKIKIKQRQDFFSYVPIRGGGGGEWTMKRPTAESPMRSYLLHHILN